jgi:hypothetical protein
VPNLEVQILPEETHVSQDLRMDRVRIFVNPNNKVSSAPIIAWSYIFY